MPITTSLPPLPPIKPAQPQGYWKENPGAWPVASLTLGSQTYSQSELRVLLGTSRSGGDASLILASQLIAAKLNVADGVFASEQVQEAIASADAILSRYSGRLPYKVKTSSSEGKGMIELADTLEMFNLGS